MILLPNRVVISVKGADAASFLQGLITNDINLLEKQPAIYAAMLTPQGKLLFDFIISKTEGGYLLDCHESRAEALLKRLNMYKLRSKVEVSRADIKVYSSATEGIADPRSAQMGKRFYGQAADNGNYEHYEKLRFENAVPETQDFVFEDDFPLQSSFEALSGVSFSKGCYVGQEVTARTKYKGNIKHAFYKVNADFELAPGMQVAAGGKVLGSIRTSHGNSAFAHLEVTDVNGAEINGKPVTLQRV